jgi:hypothetical protein
MQTKQAVTIGVAEAVCRLATFFLPDSVTSSVGEGVSVEFTKEQDLCGGGASISTKISEAVGADIYEDCLENPGRYFPADYDAPGGDMDLNDIPGFILQHARGRRGRELLRQYGHARGGGYGGRTNL